ncbi:hypothetical protein L861_06285 [Litchfieldella anticariensis FP35 = DSM 16096]|uniref:LysM domain-containing protein n=1 Tax=Litchfieldella anticariensis (strain DSM 16096 / CECT 5854 / CIP 108499 / LMG 22089 / FP35) TaxID=1121939 RepID=S2L749_LITA3|nr:LysM domain-containing protein [Halomonas anticariensis]EPC00546.1 hypothetical protein L861_06285 [Halomonas anticariensis FP35 = DSM 16096]
MSYRIDIEALRRYSENGLIQTPLTQAQQEYFQQAIEEALDARSEAGGSGALDASEERVFVVEDGDNLARIADELNVDFEALLELNERDDMPNPNQINEGDVLFVPNTSPEEAATSPRNAQGVPEGEADFVQGLREQGNDLEYADAPASVDYDAEIGELASDVQAYVEALPEDDRQAALQRIYDHDWVDAGPAQMAIEQAAEDAGIELDETSHAGPEAEAEAREIIADAQAEADPDDALQLLEERYDAASPAVQAALDRSNGTREIAENAASDFMTDAQAADDPIEALRLYEEGYATSPQRVQEALDRSSDAQDIIDNAAEWAAEPLEGELEGVENPNPQQRMLATIQRLDQLTEGRGPELTAEVVDALIPELEAANNGSLQEYGGAMVGPNGTQLLIPILDRIDGTTTGEIATDQLAQMLPVDMNTVRNAMYESVSQGDKIPALALAIASQDGVVDFREEVIATVEQFRDHTIGEQAEAYHEHLEELGYLIGTGSSAMTQEQLEAAIEEYIEAQGSEWSEELEGLREQLADSGAGLLQQIQQLQGLPDEVRADHQERIDGLLNDSNAQLAISTALQEKPELVRGEAGDALIETFNELGITGDDPLAATLVGAYLNENVLGSAADLDFTDAASMEEARNAIRETLNNNSQLAELMDISTSDLNELAELLSGVVPSEPLPGNNEFGRVNGILRNLNNTLDQIDGKFVRNTPFSTTFRTSAFAIVGSGLINAGYNFLENPDFRNSAELVTAMSRVGVDSAQLVAAYRSITNADSVHALKTAGKFVHIMGATLASFDAVMRLQEGDYWGAGLNAAAAGGVGIAVMFSSTAWGGPVGFGVATAASLGLYIKESMEEPPFETQTTADFLAHAGFSEEAAEILIERSDEGHNAVPLLMRYGELHGLTPEQTVEWVNSIPEGENGSVMLAALRDNLHNALNDLDGDVSQFNEHADGFELASPSLGESRSGTLTPQSKFELDAMLPQLDIESPQAYA